MLIFVIYKLSNDMKVFDRERADKMYGVVPYLVGDFTAHLPFYIGFPLIYSIITVSHVSVFLECLSNICSIG